MKKTFKKGFVGLALLTVLLSGCGSSSDGSSADGSSADGDAVVDKDEKRVVTIGVVGEYNAQWDTINELLEPENIVIELVKYSDYATPNPALADGDIDLNAFQHKAFLNNEIETAGFDIVSIGDTIIGPLGVFNNKDKISSIDEIKDGDTIAIPSDKTNGGRALTLLADAGLISIDPAQTDFPTRADIIEYHVEIEILEGESATLANLLPDITAAVINAGNAITAGLNPMNDTIHLENVDPAVNPNVGELINVVVARTEDKDDEVYLKIMEAYHTEEVKNTLLEAYEGGYIPAW